MSIASLKNEVFKADERPENLDVNYSIRDAL